MTLEEQFARLIKTLQLIESEPWKWDVSGLEVEFAVGRATVERDIHILRHWGTIQRRNGFFAIKSMKFLPTSFSTSEALALVLSGSMAVERIGMPYAGALDSALHKIDAVLPEQVAAMIKKMRSRLSIGINLIRECNADILDTISRAISGHNTLEITYFVPQRGEVTNRKVNPYGLTFRFGAWYLIGYCQLRGDVRTFGVDRIRMIKMLGSHFKYPKDFDLEEYLERGWSLQADGKEEHVAIRFHKRIAAWLEGCRFHPNQKITIQTDGSALFEVDIAGVEEIRHWILSFGDNAEVIAPESLRRSITETCRNMAGIYKQ